MPTVEDVLDDIEERTDVSDSLRTRARRAGEAVSSLRD